jgi:hypothetical protein
VLDLVLALLLAGVVKAEPAHQGRQHQALPDQRDDDDAEGYVLNELAVRKRRAIGERVGNRERGGERDHAAHAGE